MQVSGWFLEEVKPDEPIQSCDNRRPPSQSQTSSLEVLNSVFGHQNFLPFQEEIITQVRNGEDVLVVLPTGGGKSLCYQLPAYIFDGLTVVVSPLIALMQDQVMRLRQIGIRAAFLNHLVEEEEYIATMHEIRQGNIKLLYIAPETLVQRPEIHVMLYNSDVACLAIDEAHCISQWGHDFRPTYRELDWVREQFPDAACIALTATATPQVQRDIKQSLNFSADNQFINSFNRNNLFISVEPRFELLGQTLAFLKKHPHESGIIYCQKRKHVNWLCENLEEHGISVLPYPAGLDREERKQNQEAFIKNDVSVIVATIAFGMGIDKANVRFVLHAWLPKDIESYYQEIGRAGRDGKLAECLLLFSQDDVDNLKELIEDGHPTQREGRLESLNRLIDWANLTECRRKTLLGYFGETYEEDNCGMCDNCDMTKIKKVDLTEAAQKFLSCIVRVENSTTNVVFGEEYFISIMHNNKNNRRIPICLPVGVLYMIDILRGENQEKIIRNKHDKLSTWKIGQEYNLEQWYYLALQLLQNNFFECKPEDGTVHLTDKGREINRKRVESDARFWGFPVDSVENDFSDSTTVELNTNEFPSDEQYDCDLELLERLREKRRRIAEKELKKSSSILPIVSLKEMAVELPQTSEAFRQIRGIGEVRMKYADDFLPIIRVYCKEQGID